MQVECPNRREGAIYEKVGLALIGEIKRRAELWLQRPCVQEREFLSTEKDNHSLD